MVVNVTSIGRLCPALAQIISPDKRKRIIIFHVLTRDMRNIMVILRIVKRTVKKRQSYLILLWPFKLPQVQYMVPLQFSERFCRDVSGNWNGGKTKLLFSKCKLFPQLFRTRHRHGTKTGRAKKINEKGRRCALESGKTAGPI